MKKIAVLFFLLFFLPVYAETTGVINFSTRNVSVTTGLTGYTVNFCNATANCLGLACFIDYDSTSSGAYSGWCNATGTNCYHNNTAYGSGTNICITNTTYRTCSSGNWSAAASCSSGQTCDATSGTPGNCTTPSTTTSSGGGGSTVNVTTAKAASIIITSSPLDFDIVQGASVLKYVSVKNNGNQTLYNLTLSVSGVIWYSVTPQKISQSLMGNETTFTINFSTPEDAEVKAHAVTVEVGTHNASAKASKSFNINIKPSNKTVQEQILPNYDQYLLLLADLEANATSLELRGANVTEIKNLLLNAKDKLNQTNQSLESKDYAKAKQFLDETKALLGDASSKIDSAVIPGLKVDIIFMIVIIVIMSVAALLVYMFLPSKKKEESLSFMKGEAKKRKAK